MEILKSKQNWKTAFTKSLCRFLLGSLLTTQALASQSAPTSMSVGIGTYEGRVSALNLANDGKLVHLYTNESGNLSVVFNFPAKGLGSNIKLSGVLRQHTGSDKFNFQVLNTSGNYDTIGSTTGGTGFKIFSQALPTNLIVNGVISIRLQSSAGADDIDFDQLVLLDQSVSPVPTPLPTPKPVPSPTPTPAPSPTPVQAPPTVGSSIPAGTKWYWQLQGTVNTNIAAKVYDIDLYDNTASLFASLKQSGHKVICYFSAGTYENWRSDASQFPASTIGNTNGWPGENWVDVRNSTVRQIMANRMDLAVSKGCDGIEPDNVDGYSNSTGFSLTAQDQINFNTFLADQAHTRGLVVALKNTTGLVSSLVDKFDFAVVEECFKYNECSSYSPFISQNKAVLNAEYSNYSSSICSQAANLKFSTVFYNLNLDGSVYNPCP